ncbi:helix-turn-helix domain-containing protein [Clostridium kluyveri]|uniref:AraC family transcriptional regulator n=1 Tax=Clostridium kluyveri TaxID=1534 RepID=A0A1L5F9M3_CLOKL|nr:helix-turn-helix transcriptional regulator [Clostridium kluyveri]APM39718.1 AraC family transcriptional regulator [Clostridium kluyveri]UZQ50120.1 helix-turn-helix transcriptional regulator [Clostridium kluyveri]
MDKELYIADVRWQASFEDMIEKVQREENKTAYYYNENYIKGKTVQYEIFKGIWIVYHDFELKVNEFLPVEEKGIIEMNYCMAGRCELDYLNQKIFYVAPGDFAMAVLSSGNHKHNFPLGNYKGISITTTEENLDDFLKNMFGKTRITSYMLLHKMNVHGKFMILSNNRYIQNIMGNIISEDAFWRERAIVKFSELVLFLIDKDIQVSEIKGKYFDRRIISKVKLIKEDVTENVEKYITIKEIGNKYEINTRTFSECFKEIYGKTYYAFIREFRIKKAAGMLLNTKNTVGGIAMMVGYENASKFSKAFHDIMGMTPGKFRRR